VTHVLIVCGTRPEAIKLLPVLDACRSMSSLHTTFVSTGQHREMLEQVLKLWNVLPDVDLRLMTPDQAPSAVTALVLTHLADVLQDYRPDWVVVQGDTTTAFAASLAAFYARTQVAHVEAGLRTGSKHAPFPEEINRRLVSILSDRHFAPTASARANLLREGIPPEDIIVTGNTVIDALFHVRARIHEDAHLREELVGQFEWIDPQRRLILVTAHRRESFGSSFEEICLAIRDIAFARPDVLVVYPVHLNPSVRAPVTRLLSGPDLVDRVVLIEPVPYAQMTYLLERATVVLTDSGGIQEEAPALGKPVLVMRAVTERPEAIAAGGARLVGANRAAIVANTLELLDDERVYHEMARPRFPYGDGTAARRIAGSLAGTGDH
jgi:UDP-N-acetylglucosamine 2-epimerase (non-hydrolysing)